MCQMWRIDSIFAFNLSSYLQFNLLRWQFIRCSIQAKGRVETWEQGWTQLKYQELNTWRFLQLIIPLQLNLWKQQILNIDGIFPPGGEICLQRVGSYEEILSWRGLHDNSHLDGFCFGICQGNVIVIVIAIAIVIVMTNITMRNSQCLPA